MNAQPHSSLLNRALILAQSQRGFCAPNPSVGALVVKDGIVLSQGVHLGPSHPHAEVDAIQKAGKAVEGSTLYITLEPCCHWGRTPPCTDLIIQSKIKKVYFAFQDPNPRVAGRGAQTLQNAGIECTFVEIPEIAEFYNSYRYWTECCLPWVTAKLALSVDGKIAGVKGKTVRLTGGALNQYTHGWRKKSDALLTTVNTVLADDPQLNVRLDNTVIKKNIYLLDTELRVSPSAKIFETAKDVIVFCAEDVDLKNSKIKSVRYVPVPRVKNGLDLNAILKIIGEDGVHDLWVEAGGRCFEAFLRERLLNRALIYTAPMILGNEAMPAFQEKWDITENAKTIGWRVYGGDVVCDVRFQPN